MSIIKSLEFLEFGNIVNHLAHSPHLKVSKIGLGKETCLVKVNGL